MTTQKEKILELLEEAGTAGVTNYQLNSIAFRYSARIDDLRKDGHTIAAIKGAKSLWTFVLIPKTPVQAQMFEVAV